MTELDAQIEACEKVCDRIRDEARLATKSWILIETFFGDTTEHCVVLHQRIEHSGVSKSVNLILKALARDTLAALFRVTDPSGRDRQTFCSLVKPLEDAEFVRALEIRIASMAPAILMSDHIELARQARNHLLAYVTHDWTSVPKEAELFDLRDKLRPVRNTVLSHAMDYSTSALPAFGETRRFIQIVNSLQFATASIFYSKTDDIESRVEVARREAHRFWDVFDASLPR